MQRTLKANFVSVLYVATVFFVCTLGCKRLPKGNIATTTILNADEYHASDSLLFFTHHPQFKTFPSALYHGDSLVYRDLIYASKPHTAIVEILLKSIGKLLHCQTPTQHERCQIQVDISSAYQQIKRGNASFSARWMVSYRLATLVETYFAEKVRKEKNQQTVHTLTRLSFSEKLTLLSKLSLHDDRNNDEQTLLKLHVLLRVKHAESGVREGQLHPLIEKSWHLKNFQRSMALGYRLPITSKSYDFVIANMKWLRRHCPQIFQIKLQTHPKPSSTLLRPMTATSVACPIDILHANSGQRYETSTVIHLFSVRLKGLDEKQCQSLPCSVDDGFTFLYLPRNSAMPSVRNIDLDRGLKAHANESIAALQQMKIRLSPYLPDHNHTLIKYLGQPFLSAAQTVRSTRFIDDHNKKSVIIDGKRISTSAFYGPLFVESTLYALAFSLVQPSRLPARLTNVYASYHIIELLEEIKKSETILFSPLQKYVFDRLLGHTANEPVLEEIVRRVFPPHPSFTDDGNAHPDLAAVQTMLTRKQQLVEDLSDQLDQQKKTLIDRDNTILTYHHQVENYQKLLQELQANEMRSEAATKQLRRDVTRARRDAGSMRLSLQATKNRISELQLKNQSVAGELSDVEQSLRDANTTILRYEKKASKHDLTRSSDANDDKRQHEELLRVRSLYTTLTNENRRLAKSLKESVNRQQNETIATLEYEIRTLNIEKENRELELLSLQEAYHELETDPNTRQDALIATLKHDLTNMQREQQSLLQTADRLEQEKNALTHKLTQNNDKQKIIDLEQKIADYKQVMIELTQAHQMRQTTPTQVDPNRAAPHQREKASESETRAKIDGTHETESNDQASIATRSSEKKKVKITATNAPGRRTQAVHSRGCRIRRAH